jgi:TetR/AcrR family transcriptional repressor of nem operon
MPRQREFNEDEVLEKAIQIFWCKGYHATSAQDLVDALGISRSSLYDTFGDKRALFIKALERYRSKAARGLIEMINNTPHIEKTIAQIFKIAVKESLEDKLSKGCFVVNTTIELAPHDTDIAAIIHQNMHDIEHALLLAIEKGQALGQFSKKQSSLALARFVFNSISGLRVAARAGADKKVFDDIVSVTLSVLKL